MIYDRIKGSTSVPTPGTARRVGSIHYVSESGHVMTPNGLALPASDEPVVQAGGVSGPAAANTVWTTDMASGTGAAYLGQAK